MNFPRISDSPTWRFYPKNFQIFKERKMGLVLSLQNKMLSKICWINFSVKEYFFCVGFIHCVIWQRPLITMRLMAIIEDWQSSFPQNSIKSQKPNFAGPTGACLTAKVGALAYFFQLITKRPWIWNILIIESFNEFIYLKSDVLILSGKWRWWPSSSFFLSFLLSVFLCLFCLFVSLFLSFFQLFSCLSFSPV